MTGERDLETLLRSLKPEMASETFVFCTVDKRTCDLGEIEPLLSFTEQEGTTLIVTQQQAEAMKLPYIYPCRKITLKVHSSLEAVGMMASITTRLASEGISVNPVSAYYHDHLFIPADKAGQALKLLQAYGTDHAKS